MDKMSGIIKNSVLQTFHDRERKPKSGGMAANSAGAVATFFSIAAG